MTYMRAAVFAALVLAMGCESKKKAAPAPAAGSGSAAIVEKDPAAPVATPGSAGGAAAPTGSDAAPTGSDVPRDDDKPGTTKGRIDKYREKFKTDHPKTDAPKTP